LHDRSSQTTDRQITFAPRGHVLTNAGVWSRDGRLIAYDTRSDPAGAVFDGRSIETVDTETGRVSVVYDAAPCGVVTFDPQHDRVVFIRGPADPTPDWSYSPTHREGMLVELASPGVAVSLDARDLIPPFTPGALRGGTHVHQFSPDGKLVSFTYEDDVLARLTPGETVDRNTRAVGVTVLDRPAVVPPGPHNLSAVGFSVLVTDLIPRQTADREHPLRLEIDSPGRKARGRSRNADPCTRPSAFRPRLSTEEISTPSFGVDEALVDESYTDQITRAREEAWIGTAGYLRPGGTRQRYALAFLGEIGQHEELFIVDLPDDLTRPGTRPLQGTPTRRPAPPVGVIQRRLTWTQDRKFPGIAGPRHWPRSSRDGSAIAFLLRDDDGIPHLHTVSPNGGEVTQLTRGPLGISSAFTWSPDGRRIACVIDRSVVTVDTATGRIDRLTARSSQESAPRPEACVLSADASRIAYVRPVQDDGVEYNQIFIVTVPDMLEGA
jgi:roadblock/LC7 domain-containing protein